MGVYWDAVPGAKQSATALFGERRTRCAVSVSNYLCDILRHAIESSSPPPANSQADASWTADHCSPAVLYRLLLSLRTNPHTQKVTGQTLTRLVMSLLTKRERQNVVCLMFI